jgi:hypothetical protein
MMLFLLSISANIVRRDTHFDSAVRAPVDDVLAVRVAEWDWRENTIARWWGCLFLYMQKINSRRNTTQVLDPLSHVIYVWPCFWQATQKIC